MLQDLSPTLRNGRRSVSKPALGTLKIVAFFAVAALAILFASHTIATQTVVDASTLYGP